MILAVVVVTGCASRAAVHEVRADVSTVRAELTEVRVAQDDVFVELARALAELRAIDARAA